MTRFFWKMLMLASHTIMNDQYQSVEDLVDWDAWLQATDQPPFW
jgi:hypothetical protein